MLIPVGYRVLVKPDSLEEDKAFKKAKEAGIAIPKNIEAMQILERQLDTGTVVMLGHTAFKVFQREGEYDGEPWVKVGDRVSYAKYAGKSIIDPEDDQRYLVLADEDINAVIKNA